MEHPATGADELRGTAQGKGDTDACARACLEAALRCQEARAYASAQGGRLAERKLLDLLLDCTEACELTARWVQRESAFQGDLAAVCATICKSCEAACAERGSEAPLKACASACRKCFDVCLRMGEGQQVLTH